MVKCVTHYMDIRWHTHHEWNSKFKVCYIIIADDILLYKNISLLCGMFKDKDVGVKRGHVSQFLNKYTGPRVGNKFNTFASSTVCDIFQDLCTN